MAIKRRRRHLPKINAKRSIAAWNEFGKRAKRKGN